MIKFYLKFSICAKLKQVVCSLRKLVFNIKEIFASWNMCSFLHYLCVIKSCSKRFCDSAKATQQYSHKVIIFFERFNLPHLNFWLSATFLECSIHLRVLPVWKVSFRVTFSLISSRFWNSEGHFTYIHIIWLSPALILCSYGAILILVIYFLSS